MVGKDDIIASSSPRLSEKNDTSTYARRKKEKKAKVQIVEESAVDNVLDNSDYMKLVDNFVQDVIERAKKEYLNSRANGGVAVETRASGENEKERLYPDEAQGKDEERSKKSTGNKKQNAKSSGRRKPHYKYSGPVDEREISGYESPEASRLLTKRSEFDVEDPGEAENTIYNRIANTLRRLLSCCSGKTWSP